MSLAHVDLISSRRRLTMPVVWGALAAFAVLLGLLISKQNYVRLGLLVVGIPLMALPLFSIRVSFWLLVISALLQIPIGDFAGVPSLAVTEVIVPMVAAGFMLRYMVEGGFWASFRRPRTALLHFLLLFFLLVLIGNYIRRPLLPSHLVTGSTEADNGLRVYYDYFLGFIVFAIVYFAVARRFVSLNAVVTGLLVISTVICAIGLVAVALNIPLNLGQLKYSVFRYGYGAVRVGFLELFSVVGLAMVVARAGPFRKTKWILILGPLFLAALLFSGGRATALGLIAGTLIFLLLKHPARMAVTLLLTFVVLISIPRAWYSSPQFQRFSAQEISTSDRIYINELAIKEWAKNPIFGSGIGAPVTVSGPNPELAAFYAEQLRIGGHALYATLLKNLGLIGFVPFIGLLLLTLKRLASAVGRSKRDVSAAARVPAFLFLVLLSASLASAGGGNGVGGNLYDPALFLTLGLSAAAIELSPAPRRAPVLARQPPAPDRMRIPPPAVQGAR